MRFALAVCLTVISGVFLVAAGTVSHPIDDHAINCLLTSVIFALLAIAWRPE